MKKRLAAIVMLLCWCGLMVASTPSAGEDLVRSEWMKGYDSMESADRAYDAGNYIAAAKLYGEAMVVFVEVQRKYPQWHASLQAFRLKYCRERVEELESKVKKTISDMDETALRKMISSQAETLQSQMDKISQLTGELASAKASLQRARAEAARNAASREELKQLKEAKVILEETVQLLENKLEQAQKENEALAARLESGEGAKKEGQEQLKAAVAQLESFRQENKKLKEQLEDVSKQLERTERLRSGLEEQQKKIVEQAKKLEGEFRKTSDKLAEKERNLSERNGKIGTLQYKIEQLERENALQQERLSEKESKSHEDELLEMVKKANDELQQCREQLVAAKSQLQTAKDEGNADHQELLSLRRAFAEMEEQKNALQSDLNVYSSKLNDNLQKYRENAGEVEQLADDNQTLQQERADLMQLVDSRGKLIATQEQEIADLKKKFSDSQATLQKAAERIERLISAGLKEDAAEGMNKNYGDAVNEAREQKVLAVRLQLEVEKLASDNKLLQEQVKQNEQLIQALNAAGGATGNQAMDDLKAKLYAEIKKRQELEIILIQRDSEEHIRSIASSADGKKGESLAVPGVVPALSLNTEQMILVNGFLRQAVDAEKAGNLETAQWNYGKVLELEPENFLALKRMGLIAVNGGDDGAASRYLKSAFRQNPDDQEVLLGLGYSMLQMEQPEWALASLARAVALKPDDETIQCQFAASLAEMRWTEAALVQYQAVWKRSQSNPDVPFNIALIYLNRYSDAQKSVSSAETDDKKALYRADADRALKEARSWYSIAREHGVDADPALEKLLMTK